MSRNKKPETYQCRCPTWWRPSLGLAVSRQKYIGYIYPRQPIGWRVIVSPFLMTSISSADAWLISRLEPIWTKVKSNTCIQLKLRFAGSGSWIRGATPGFRLRVVTTNRSTGVTKTKFHIYLTLYQNHNYIIIVNIILKTMFTSILHSYIININTNHILLKSVIRYNII